jgi:hypothetical protein
MLQQVADLAGPERAERAVRDLQRQRGQPLVPKFSLFIKSHHVNMIKMCQQKRINHHYDD